VADAYDGQYIKTCTDVFLKSCAGQIKTTLNVADINLGLHGNANVVAYIGHNGLMDFDLENNYTNTDNITRQSIILGCISKKYFSPFLKQAKAYPLLTTTGLMAPEAYIIHDALEAYLGKQSNQTVALQAAAAYHKYQHCGLNAAKKLLVTGW
jgi:hypothetical protein